VGRKFLGVRDVTSLYEWGTRWRHKRQWLVQSEQELLKRELRLEMGRRSTKAN